eukprot:SAG11_NODE_3592_length_2349_cov_3.311556_1_plen_382_part_00
MFSCARVDWCESPLRQVSVSAAPAESHPWPSPSESSSPRPSGGVSATRCAPASSANLARTRMALSPSNLPSRAESRERKTDRVAETEHDRIDARLAHRSGRWILCGHICQRGRRASSAGAHGSIAHLLELEREILDHCCHGHLAHRVRPRHCIRTRSALNVRNRSNRVQSAGCGCTVVEQPDNARGSNDERRLAARQRTRRHHRRHKCLEYVHRTEHIYLRERRLRCDSRWRVVCACMVARAGRRARRAEEVKKGWRGSTDEMHGWLRCKQDQRTSKTWRHASIVFDAGFSIIPPACAGPWMPALLQPRNIEHMRVRMCTKLQHNSWQRSKTTLSGRNDSYLKRNAIFAPPEKLCTAAAAATQSASRVTLHGCVRGTVQRY